MPHEYIPRGEPVTQAEAVALRVECERDGDDAVAKRIGISRMGIARVIARLPVSRGNRALVRVYLESPERHAA